MRKFIILVLIAVVLAGCAGQPTPAPGPSTSVDDEPLPPAPLFELKDLKGEEWSLQELQGEVVVLYFWTASCPNCLDKLPELAELQKELPQDVKLLLLNGGDTKARVQEVIEDYPNLTVLMDANSMFTPYGVRYVPTTIFIDRQGNFSQGYIGPIPNDGLMEIIEGLR